jgi:Flp pilus assembly protein TadB
MEELLTRVWEHLGGRVGGPLTLRLFIQPTVALILAIRAGLKDSREERMPYFWNVLFNAAHRKELVQDGWKDTAKLFTMACVLDVVYQLVVARWVYPLETLIVAIVLAILPYVISRGLVGRLARRWTRRQQSRARMPES